MKLCSSKENAIPRTWGQIPEQSRVEGYTLGSCKEKGEPMLFIEHLLFIGGDIDDVAALPSL